MNIVDIKCPNCGSSLKIENKEDSCVCKYCGSQFLIKEAMKKNKQENKEQNTQIESSSTNKVDDKLYNEVDKYIADYNINEFDRLERIVGILKELYPHKGLARIVILHYEFTMFFKIVHYETFLKEPDVLKTKCETYNPKSCRQVPPYTGFLKELKSIDIKYAEDLEEVLSDEDIERYDDLCKRTLSYIKAYNDIFAYNAELYKKFMPFEKKFQRKQKFKAKLKSKKTKKFILSSIAVSIVVAFLMLMFFAFYGVKITMPSLPISTFAYTKDYLPSPYMSEIYDPIELETVSPVKLTAVKKYEIYGRVLDVKSYLPITRRNMARSVSITLEWGDMNQDYSVKGHNYYSTNELYASNKLMLKQLRKIKKGDLIGITGYLVNVDVNYLLFSLNYPTSTSLDDEYSEIIYVKDVYLLT